MTLRESYDQIDRYLVIFVDRKHILILTYGILARPDESRSKHLLKDDHLVRRYEYIRIECWP